MPLYEYKCRKCGECFEEIRKFSDPPLTTHERCGGELKKLLSPPAIQFKGTGWYVTDYAKKSGEPQDTEQKKTEKTEKGAKTEKEKMASSDTKSASTTTKT